MVSVPSSASAWRLNPGHLLALCVRDSHAASSSPAEDTARTVLRRARPDRPGPLRSSTAGLCCLCLSTTSTTVATLARSSSPCGHGPLPTSCLLTASGLQSSPPCRPWVCQSEEWLRHFAGPPLPLVLLGLLPRSAVALQLCVLGQA